MITPVQIDKHKQKRTRFPGTHECSVSKAYLQFPPLVHVVIIVELLLRRGFKPEPRKTPRRKAGTSANFNDNVGFLAMLMSSYRTMGRLSKLFFSKSFTPLLLPKSVPRCHH